MINILTAGQRQNEWRQTFNSEAPVLGDRAKYSAGTTGLKSVHTNPSSAAANEWRGSVGFNDNHVTFEATHDQLETQYGDQSVTNDNLFNTTGVVAVNDYDDALAGDPIVDAANNCGLAYSLDTVYISAP